MIPFEEIKSFFAEGIRKNPVHYEYMLKEYFHYRMLDIIFSGEFASKMRFIGGTNLRILHSCQETNFEIKSRDFENLVFDKAETRKMLFFKEYVGQKLNQTQ